MCFEDIRQAIKSGALNEVRLTSLMTTVLNLLILMGGLFCIVLMLMAIIRKLLTAFMSIRNNEDITPLFEAALHGKENATLTLINKFGCDANIKGQLGRSLLHHACEGGNVCLVDTLIVNHNADVNARDDQNNTPLNVAAFMGNEDIALALINEFGCDANVKGRYGRSVLHHACEGGNVSLVRTLIVEHKADVNAQDDQNDTPLNVAAFTGNEDIALALINEFGCDYKIKGRCGRSVLHSACSTKHANADLVQYLIHHLNMSLLLVDDYGNTPLHTCSLFGTKECAKVLLSANALIFVKNSNEKSPLELARGEIKSLLDGYLQLRNFSNVIAFPLGKVGLLFGKYSVKPTDSKGCTLLHYACTYGRLDIIRMLLTEFKADVHICNNEGNTPLHMAAFHGKENVTLALINEFGCDANIKGQWGRSVLHHACEGGNVSLMCTLLVKHKADINAQDDHNNTPLHVAAFSGKKDAALALINEFGCNANIKGHWGRSVLHHACEGGNVSLVRTLIVKHKADINAQDDHNDTPLHIAAFSGKKDAALALINEFGCDANVKGKIGRSVLHNACLGGNVSLMHTLIVEHKANINARDDENNTPLHLAAFSGKKDAALALINEFGCDANIKGLIGRSVLHNACQGGNVSLMQALIVDHKADVNARDDKNNTPLHLAAFKGQEDTVLALINEFDCDSNIKGQVGRSILHHACEGGNVSLVRTLIVKHRADINARDDHNNTPLHVAAFSGRKDVALALINEFGCNTNVKGLIGRSVFHDACQGGNVSLMHTLIVKHRADVNARDDKNNTPLHVAAFSGKKDAALVLINEFGCDVNVKGQIGRSVLHYACYGGNVSLMQTLIVDHKADVNARDDENSTPLHLAAFKGQEDTVLALINEFGCDSNIKGQVGKSVLHYACEGGNVSLVRTLIVKHKADINARNDHNNTPLHVTAFSGMKDAALALINEFGCDANVKDHIGRSVLHHACQGGNLSLVQTLIVKHRADINARDDENDTPLNITAFSGKEDTVLALINEFGCDSNIKGRWGRSVLHNACEGGNVSLVHTLIVKHKADINVQDDQNNTPLHVAAFKGKKDVALALINKFGCDYKIKGQCGRSVLHSACSSTHANASLVQHLIQCLNMSFLLVDDDGNTPLHTCSSFGTKECAEVLLSANAPIFIRNNNGQSPLDLARGEVKSQLESYLLLNKDKLIEDYRILQNSAEKKYSGHQANTRIFVVGNSGAGKSSLIYSLKSERFLDSFWRVTESSVPLHTAGIIPSIHNSKHYGRVLFYDFAGDPEYYSSHAAILENLASSSKGDNIFLVVVDLREADEKIATSLQYWLAFICNQKFSNEPFLFVLGSHSDQITEKVASVKEKFLKQKCKQFSQSRIPLQDFMLDCCKPGSTGITSLQKHLATLTKSFSEYKLSLEANILLGLLEEDFSNAIAFPLDTLITYIKDTGVVLPKDFDSLHLILKELHELGLLFLVGSSTEDNIQVVWNISKLTNQVHKKLFSLEAQAGLAKSNLAGGISSFNIGILPENVLSKILPQCITNECLLHLQYCHQIKSTDIGLFCSTSQASTPNKPFLFFPALCSAEKGTVTWTTPSAEQCYSIGWLARCTSLGQHFPSRFLHVLLLRLVFRFTAAPAPCSQSSSQLPRPADYQHRCTLWKTGLRWNMKEGVECMFELVNASKDLVVMTRSKKDREENCVSIFNDLITYIMEAKAEFCHSLTPQFFLLDSTDEADYLSEDNMFDINEVESALTSPPKETGILSITGEKFMERRKLVCIRKLTLWDSLFPIEFSSVLHYLKELVKSLVHLSVSLDIPHSVWEAIEVAHPRDVERWRRELVRAWMSSSSDPPCWYRLVEALKFIEKATLASSIEEQHSLHIRIQKKLLCEESATPDDEFLECFSSVVGGKWPSLASLLSLSSSEIEEVKEEKNLSQKDQAHLMLKKWVSKGGATYAQLRNELKTNSLFHGVC